MGRKPVYNDPKELEELNESLEWRRQFGIAFNMGYVTYNAEKGIRATSTATKKKYRRICDDQIYARLHKEDEK